MVSVQLVNQFMRLLRPLTMSAETAFDPDAPYYDEKSNREKPKWCGEQTCGLSTLREAMLTRILASRTCCISTQIPTTRVIEGTSAVCKARRSPRKHADFEDVKAERVPSQQERMGLHPYAGGGGC